MENLNLKRILWIPAMLVILVICIGSLHVPNLSAFNDDNDPTNDWESALKTQFRNEYGTMAYNYAKRMHAEYPVITQDLLNMTLTRSNGTQVRFSMNKKTYMTLAHSTHPPLTLYSILYPVEFQISNDSIVKKLKAYQQLLQDSKKGVNQSTHLSDTQKHRIHTLLKESEKFVETIISDPKKIKARYEAYAKSVRPLIEKNLHDGAREQLNQFRDQLIQWKNKFPDENWDEMRVVILGFHQPRELYVLKQLFQWLLDEPGFEKQVVYAEFQSGIFGKQRVAAEIQALTLLTKVDLDREASLILLGNENQLQKDVMGPAAVKILKEWGPSDW